MRIFLFGSSGMLGNTIFHYFKKSFDVIQINRGKFDVELNTFKELKSILDEYNVKSDDVIVNCIGLLPHRFNSDSMKEQNFCGEIVKKFILVNSIFPHHLEKIHLIYKCNVIHITSDCVYSGNKGHYNEEDNFDLFNIYGITKTSGESTEICTIRTSIIGHEKYNKKSLLEWVISQKDKTINGYSNYLWNGLTCLELSKVISYIIINKKYWNGVRHIHSPNSVSKYELCQYINEIYKLNINIVDYKLESKVDRTLSSIYSLEGCGISEIRNQITDLKHFHD